jgi:hypothetical protein
MLHGAGSNHRLALRRVFGKSNQQGETDVEATRYFPKWQNIDFIVASPYARGTVGYQGIPEKDVYDVLADVKKRLNIDEDRIYLTGLSMGGGGTLWIGLTHPDIWAAIAPVCPAPPDGTMDLAGNALNIPVHIFQGGADPVVKPEGTRNWVKKFQDLGVKVEYNEYPGVMHNVWENAYQDESIFTWFNAFSRNRFPDRVMFSTKQLKYNEAYWIRINELIPGILGTIDAKFDSKNHLEIKTSGLVSFTLTLSGHPQYNPGQSLQLVIDGLTFNTKVKDSITFLLQNGKWTPGIYNADENAKKRGSEGPIGEAFTSRHIYVYGTLGKPTPQELKTRAETAQQAANWSFYRGEFLGRVMVFPRVLSDMEIRPSDLESSNLVLFGTRETNAIIAKYSDKLPMELNADSTAYGLLYVYPVNGHYFVINSGLAWWTGVQPEGFPFVPTALRVLPGFKDYILFRESIKNVQAEGYFDSEWKLPDHDADIMKSTGTINFISK